MTSHRYRVIYLYSVDKSEVDTFSSERSFIKFADLLPVHNTPPGIDVLWAAILIVEIVGVFPNVNAQDGVHDLTHRGAFHQRIVLVWRCDNL